MYIPTGAQAEEIDRTMVLDKIDSNLLNIIQSEFPLYRQPFSRLGAALDISTSEAIDRIERLKAVGIIRLIGPVLNPKSLGYRTTLIAAKVPDQYLDNASRLIGEHPMISHGYLRDDHDFNLWFTLAIPITEDLDIEARKLGMVMKVETIINLPALKTFKIEAIFILVTAHSNRALSSQRTEPKARVANKYNLSAIDRAVINVLQEDLPSNEQPFDSLSKKMSMDADEFLGHCRNLLQLGIMRRFSAAVNHSRLGFIANAMTCWQVPPTQVDNVGKKIATFGEVSHCYKRQTNSLWPHNLFAMVHADSRENCLAIIDRICTEAFLENNKRKILFSIKELKKTRVKYKV